MLTRAIEYRDVGLPFEVGYCTACGLSVDCLSGEDVCSCDRALPSPPMADRRRPGRPPLSEDERTVGVLVRMTESERDALNAAAAARGEKVAEYARRVLLARARRDLRASE